MARTKQVKKPCELCGREIVSSAMHQHLKKCQRENGQPAEPAPSSTESVKTDTKTERTEVILVTEPKTEAQETSSKEESGLSRFFGSLADFVKDHPDEMMPMLATAAAVLFPGQLQAMNAQQPQLAAAEDNRSWAEKGHW